MMTSRQRAMREASELELDATLEVLRDALVHVIEQRIELEAENEKAALDILRLTRERDELASALSKKDTGA